MLLYEEVIRKEKKITGFECDVCGTDYYGNTIEYQECQIIDINGGYGSVFGDGCQLQLVICQHCLWDRFRDFTNKV